MKSEGPGFFFSKIEQFKNIGCESEHVCFFKVAPFKLQTPANDRKSPGDFDSWAEMFVRVWSGRFMVETLCHYKFGPNVVLETLEL